MAAFTNQFDISGGLVPQLDVEEAEKVQIELNRDSLSVLQAQNWRSRRLPTLNARGIAIVMTISRVSLLVQYVAGGLLLPLAPNPLLTTAFSFRLC
jgi:hypothetical protein